jgi:site-specific DNA recombinase
MVDVRAALYARASSNQQLIGNQLAELRARVADDALRVPAEREFVDEGYSGATLMRPGLDHLRELIAEGGIDRLYVQSPDRLARLSAQQALLVTECQAAGIAVVFVSGVHATPDGKMLLHA